MFLGLICRTRFNRRRRRLQSHIVAVKDKIARLLKDQSEAIVIDSIPVPVVKLVRKKTHKAFRKNFDAAPAKGYTAINRGWLIGTNFMQ